MSGPVASPLRVGDCCANADGSSCVIVANEEKAKALSKKPVWILGLGAASASVNRSGRDVFSGLNVAEQAGKMAYEMAGVTPKDIDVAEVHDCFTIAEIIATEDLGFFPAGAGWEAAEEGQTARNGSRPINTSGGLKSKGHPVGASGAGQVIEIWKQLRGVASARQVPGADLGLTHNVGGTGQTCVVHIFERR